MTPDNQSPDLTDLADDTLAGPEWDAWLAAHPAAAAEVAIARRVRALMHDLAAVQIVVPDGFEERLMARLRQDRTLLDLLDLSFFSAGRAMIELINLLLSLLPTPQPAV
jgi:anti-sigma factor RsiW